MPESTDHPFLYCEIGERLIRRLDLIRFQPKVIADVGCRSGAISALLLKKYPKAVVMGLETTLPEVIKAQKQAPWLRTLHGIVAIPEALPLPTASCDLVFSHLVLPWCQDVGRVLQEFQRVLKPEGALLFSTLGPETAPASQEEWVVHMGSVPQLLDMQDIGDALVRVGLAHPVMDVDRLTVHCGEAVEPLHCEVVYGHAWGTGTASTGVRKAGEVVFPLAALRRKERTS